MSRRRTPILVVLALCAGAATAAAGQGPIAPAPCAGPKPDAEIFATSNRATITDPADPRLQRRLTDFARTVTRQVDLRGGVPCASELLDGVFFSSDLGTVTFERSRSFAVDGVTPAELRSMAEAVRRRFDQESVLTFDHLPAASRRVDGVKLRVPGVAIEDLREALLTDQQVRERLFGGSVTLDGELILIASLGDVGLAKQLAKRLGGDLDQAEVTHGDVDFVSA